MRKTKDSNMKTLITGKNLDIGNSLRKHIETRISSNVSKYFESAIRAHVTVEKQKNTFISECILHLSTGMTLNAKGQGGDAYSSFDIALEHLEKRLRRYTRRLKNHHNSRKAPMLSADAASFVIASGDIDEPEETDELNPAIIAETTHQISEMTVGEAVMQLELSDLQFVLFNHDKYQRINVVYRRDDGNIGWIDPEPGSKK